MIRVEVRPLLVQGMLAVPTEGLGPLPVIYIADDLDQMEQATTLWHEVAHLLGITNEDDAEILARRLASACPDIMACIANASPPQKSGGKE